MRKYTLLLCLPFIVLPSLAIANSGDFSGAVAIGTSYAGAVTPPTNGLAVQGATAIGSSAANTGAALDLGSNTSSLLLPIGTTGTRPGTGVNGMLRYNSTTPAVEAYVNNAWAQLIAGVTSLTPQGRLTLSTNTPVMTTNVTGVSTIYYAAYTGDNIFIYSGSSWGGYPINGQLSLALDSNSGHTGYQQSGKNFDIFVGLNGGGPTLCTGPAWTSDTARGTGAGTTEIQMLNGIWTNKNSLTCRHGTASGDTFTCAANQCTLTGSLRATANGQTGFKCYPINTAGGSADILGISNAYNAIPVTCASADSTSVWTYAGTTFRAANNSTSNSISRIDTLAQSTVDLTYTVNASANATAAEPYIGIGIDGTSLTLQGMMSSSSATVANNWVQLYINFPGNPALGYHSYYATENCFGGTCSFGRNGNSMALTLRTTY